MSDQQAARSLQNEKQNTAKPEIWGGMECTINRVNNIFLDQLERAGHYFRETDMDLIANLGIKRLRFPILWEKHEPVKGQSVDWSQTDISLKKLRENHIVPIAGLVHHGSGPSYTSLSDQSFASGIAEYAKKVAERYPWLEYYTPVNEPLTTARFSGLYGFWYPHEKSDSAFCHMLINQLTGTVLSMKEIRKINPDAKLIQTEDLAKTYSVPSLQYQADFENDRRWITFDLLCGLVDKEHPLWDFFIRSGITEKSLLFFSENPCPPNVLGFNYYVTSERFLDNRLDNYPEYMHGGNWFEPYVDTEAIRIDHGEPSGLAMLLKEAHERYQMPMAITECHLNCTSEEKMRWFKETWDTCVELRNEGMPIEAVTAWSLFGAFGWNRLLTTEDGDYEPGVFDLRAESPRPTAMAGLLTSLSLKGEYSHPVFAQKGWWHRRDRFFIKNDWPEFPAIQNCGVHARPLLIFGFDEILISEFITACKKRSLHVEAVCITPGSLNNVLVDKIKEYSPWAVVGLLCDDESAQQRNAISDECMANKIKFMMITSWNAESSLQNPANDSLIINAGAIFSAKYNAEIIPSGASYGLQSLPENSCDNNSGLAYLPDLADTALDLMIDDVRGEINLAHDLSPLMPPLKNALQRFMLEMEVQAMSEFDYSERA